MSAESEYRKEPWNREKSDAYIVELENIVDELIPIAQHLTKLLGSGGTYDFFNEHDWEESNRIDKILQKIVDISAV